jgi:stress responsive alpha/beta barrel protein
MNIKPLAVAAAVLLGVFLASTSLAAEPAAGREKPKGAEGGTPAKGALYHVVSLKFKDSATKEQVKAVEDAFRGLKEKVPGITLLKWGTNVSPEKLNKGFTHCFVLTFAGEKERDVYLVHPEHQAFGKLLRPVLDDVFVIDFKASE